MDMTSDAPRRRLRYLPLLAIVPLLGLASRSHDIQLPPFIASYAGDTLWALMVFLVVAVLAPRWSTARVWVVSCAISFAVEISQLYHAPWIDAVRRTWPGAMLLGFGFLWSDLVCYLVGVTIGAAIDLLLSGRGAPRKNRGV